MRSGVTSQGTFFRLQNSVIQLTMFVSIVSMWALLLSSPMRGQGQSAPEVLFEIRYKQGVHWNATPSYYNVLSDQHSYRKTLTTSGPALGEGISECTLSISGSNKALQIDFNMSCVYSYLYNRAQSLFAGAESETSGSSSYFPNVTVWVKGEPGTPYITEHQAQMNTTAEFNGILDNIWYSPDIYSNITAGFYQEPIYGLQWYIHCSSMFPDGSSPNELTSTKTDAGRTSSATLVHNGEIYSRAGVYFSRANVFCSGAPYSPDFLNGNYTISGSASGSIRIRVSREIAITSARMVGPKNLEVKVQTGAYDGTRPVSLHMVVNGQPIDTPVRALPTGEHTFVVDFERDGSQPVPRFTTNQRFTITACLTRPDNTIGASSRDMAILLPLITIHGFTDYYMPGAWERSIGRRSDTALSGSQLFGEGYRLSGDAPYATLYSLSYLATKALGSDLRAGMPEFHTLIQLIRQNTYADKVDILGYSFGGVMARVCVAENVVTPEGQNVVHSVITLGSPHAGTPWAYFARDPLVRLLGLFTKNARNLYPLWPWWKNWPIIASYRYYPGSTLDARSTAGKWVYAAILCA